jgi:VanZ family protein
VKKAFLPALFFAFICIVIAMADRANYNFAFRVIGFFPYGDKIAHALLFGILALLVNRALDFKRYYSLYLGSILVLAFATAEEFSQLFISSRSFDLKDLLADFIGVYIISKVYKWKATI